MRMPIMDRHEATRRIKSAAQGQPPTIVALTASVFESERAVLAAGCDDFVRKPCREEELVVCLVKHLGVEMRYTEPAPAAHPPLATEITVVWDALPPGWIAQVQSAAIAADLATLSNLFAQIQASQPQLAATLCAHLDAYDYQAITDLLVS